MSIQESSVPVPPLPSVAPAQERAPSPSNSLGGAPTIDPPPRKKTAGRKKRTSKRKVAKKIKPVEPADVPAPSPSPSPTPAPAPRRAQNRYEPYRKASPTPEQEGNLPADTEELKTLDATAKTLYKSDRGVLEYIDSLRRRTAAMLEHVNRTDSQLRSSKGAMERIQLFVAQWEEIGDQWSHEQLSGGNVDALGSDGSGDNEDNTPNPDLPPTLTRDKNGAFSKDTDRPDFPHKYVQTLPARQPSSPPGHEDENVLEYVEDPVETRSDRVAIAYNHSTFDRPGADLKITPDAGGSADPVAALATRLPANPSRRHHPLAQSHISSSPGSAPQPESQYLVVSHSTPRAPSLSHNILAGKRKRVSTPEEEEELGNVGNIAGSSTAVVHTEARSNKDKGAPKRQRLIARQPILDPSTRADPSAGEGSLGSSKPAHGRAFPSYIATPQIRKEDSGLQRSQVIEMPSQDVEQGEPEDGKGSGNGNTRPEAGTAGSQVPAEVAATIPEDVFGPIVLSARANKISKAFGKDADSDGGVVTSDSKYQTTKNSSKSTRFSFDNRVEKEEHRVFPKTPIGPGTSSGALQAEDALATEVEAESQDTPKPPSSPQKKRATGERARKPKASFPTEPEPATHPENELSPTASQSTQSTNRGFCWITLDPNGRLSLR